MKAVVTGMVLLMVCGFGVHAAAVETAELDGNSYNITLFCDGDLGDYCDGGQIKRDEFEFDDDDFIIDSLDDELYGLGGSGEYSQSGFFFSADYEVVDDGLDKYEFDIQGVNLLDRVILGTIEAEYSEWELISYEKEDEATIYFIGIQ